MANYELRIETSEMKKALDVLLTVISKKPALPVMADVCIRFDRSRQLFTLTATNTEQWITLDATKPKDQDGKELRPWMFLDRDDKQAPFEVVCIPAVALREAFAGLPSMPVRAQLDMEKHSLHVEYGKGKFTMPADSADDYPVPPFVVEQGGQQKEGVNPVIKFSIETLRLLPMIAAARVCVTNDELRPVLNTVCLDCFHDRAVIVSSDGHALYKKSLDTGMGWLRYGEFPATDSAKLLLPLAVLSPLVKALADTESITVTADTQRVSIVSDNGICVSTVAVDGRYPNYDSAIPKNNKHRLLIDRMEMQATLRRITLFSEESSNLCIMHRTEGHIELSAADNALGRNAAEQVAIINAEDTTLPDGYEMGFRISTMQKMLGCITTDNVLLEISEPNQALLLKEDNRISSLTLLVMPMVVN